MSKESRLPRSLAFVSVGPQRTGTSWLHKYLRDHPELAFPLHVKETKFFDQRFDMGFDWYWNHFGNVSGAVKRSEIAPTYFHSAEALKRLTSFEGLRVMIHLRDPVARTWSLFRHHRNKGRVPDDYFEAVELMPEIESSGQYAVYCEQWEEAFGSAQCLYVPLRDLETNPQAMIDQICDFIDVERIELPTDAENSFGQLQQPRFMGIARVSAAMALRLRTSGLHRVVEMAKSIGLKRVLLGPPAASDAIPERVRDHLLAHHATDIEFLERRFGGFSSEIEIESSAISHA